MAQRQIRSDDTSVWLDGYGYGSAGIYTQSNTIADSSRSGYALTTFTGTSGGNTGTAGSGVGFSANDLVIIHQAQGTGANTNPNWEFNKISSIGSGTNWTLSYNLTLTYSAGAQVYRLIQYSTFNLLSGAGLSATPWQGSTGGLMAIMANQSISVPGNLFVNGTNILQGYGSATNIGGGFRTFASPIVNNTGTQGESYSGTGTQSTSANNTGGGGGDAVGGGGGGGGGGLATSGGNGSARGVSSVGGTGGGTGGTASLQILEFGGGGGTAGDSHSGGTGGGILVLISPIITVTGSATAVGGQGANGNGAGGGGGGAGGSILLKGNIINLGTNLVTATGGVGGTDTGTPASTGGTGGNGYIHADYGTSIAGTTNPTLNSRQDNTLVPKTGGTFLFQQM